MTDAGADLRTVRFTGRDQAQQRPGRLRGRHLALPLEARVVITATTLAPAAAKLLRLPQPGDGLPHHGIAHVKADAAETLQDLPGTVEIIDAPAADPTAITRLRTAKKLKRPTHVRVPG